VGACESESCDFKMGSEEPESGAECPGKVTSVDPDCTLSSVTFLHERSAKKASKSKEFTLFIG
ncbi:MAG: hypothetical protein KDC85_19085, partial [Saprospiraceae bacterium]|nr:hypothetical protein [Saprospiraceae bacterium]